jgi:hypothetical protein
MKKTLALLLITVSTICQAQTFVKKDRYFLITITYDTGGRTGSAFYTSVGQFPSQQNIFEWCVKSYKAKNFVINNIYEFKTKEDYLQFRDGKP